MVREARSLRGEERESGRKRTWLEHGVRRDISNEMTTGLESAMSLVNNLLLKYVVTVQGVQSSPGEIIETSLIQILISMLNN